MRARGFTLLEVLVALVVVATALAGGLGIATRVASGTDALERRQFAQWVLQDRLVELQLSTAPDEEARGTREMMMAGRRFLVEARVVPLAGGGVFDVYLTAREPDGAVVESARGAVGDTW